MILVRNIRLPLSAGEPQAFEKALHTLRVPRSKVEHTGVAKLSVDARHGQPKLVYTVAVTLRQPGEEAALAARPGADRPCGYLSPMRRTCPGLGSPRPSFSALRRSS